MAGKLVDRVRDAIRARHYSRRTEEAYAHWIRRYIVFHHKQHPEKLGATDVGAFLTWLAVNQHVSGSTQNQALSALLFLYREVLAIDLGSIDRVPPSRVPERVPVVLSRDEAPRISNERALEGRKGERLGITVQCHLCGGTRMTTGKHYEFGLGKDMKRNWAGMGLGAALGMLGLGVRGPLWTGNIVRLRLALCDQCAKEKRVWGSLLAEFATVTEADCQHHPWVERSVP